MKNFKLIIESIELNTSKDNQKDPHLIKLGEVIVEENSIKNFKTYVEDYLFSKKLKINLLDSNCNFYYQSGLIEIHFKIILKNKELYEEIFNWLDSELL